jgi:putative addiction module killer protein
MIEVRKTDEFDVWLSALSDHKAVAKITTRIERLALGNPGDVRAVGGGVSEMPSWSELPGLFKQTGKEIVLLLCGGDKATQDKDIRRAKEIAAEL